MSEETKNKAPETVELTDVPSVIRLPVNAVEAVLTITVFKDGELIKVEKRLDTEDIRHAIQDAEGNYMDPDAVFTLTDKGREYAERMLLDKEGL